MTGPRGGRHPEERSPLEMGAGTSPDMAGRTGSEPESGARRIGPRLLLLGIPALVGAALALGGGLTSQGRRPAAGDRRQMALAQPLALPRAGDAAPAPAVPAPSPSPPVPAPDPRVTRALDTRVRLQAGKTALSTVLRRLGVELSWPGAGEPEWTLDDRQFSRGLRRLSRRVEHLPRSARLLHRGDVFQAVPARPGRVLDRDEARRRLLAALSGPAFRRSLDAAPPAKPMALTLSLPLREVPPTVTGDHLGSINTLLATYSTGLGGSSRNRRHNIRVACEAIDGTVLLPGELFSYNQIVGPRSERAGFRTAPVIIHGELVPGTGGGVCQVSSTLYNIALLGDLKIVRRSHHQFPVHYVPPGRDATVAYGSLDLRFANSLPGPVALDVKEIGSRVVVHLYGTAACKRDVRLVSSRVSRTRPRVPAGGGPARPGKRVSVSRVVHLADGTVRRELISHDVYAPAPVSAHSSLKRHRRAHRRSVHRVDQEPRSTALKPMAPTP